MDEAIETDGKSGFRSAFRETQHRCLSSLHREVVRHVHDSPSLEGEHADDRTEVGAPTVKRTCVGVERISSKVTLIPDPMRLRNMEKMSSRLRQCGPFGSAFVQRASSA